MASDSNPPETGELSPGSNITLPVALPDPARDPQLKHLPPPIAKGAAPCVFTDGFRVRAMDFPSEQAVWVPSVPSRSIIEPAIEHESLLAFRLAHNPPPSPSLPLSPTIEGSPRMTLPFPLIPATPAGSRSQESLPEAQTLSSQSPRGNSTSDEAPGPIRAHVKLTKKGKPYTRDRQPELTNPPNQKKVSRTTWCQWEKDAALEAIDWYEQENPAFVLSKSTDRERKLALPVIYNHIISIVVPKRWRRTYDGLLTWTANARKRPTLRRPAGWDGTTTGESAKCVTSSKATADKPKQTTKAA
ncbi:hypothetical protein FRC00_001202 [Tulasnella sp. 408]|nr:hypothetical protein FRC00_001202 [Tulasnella sp. 408]